MNTVCAFVNAVRSEWGSRTSPWTREIFSASFWDAGELVLRVMPRMVYCWDREGSFSTW